MFNLYVGWFLPYWLLFLFLSVFLGNGYYTFCSDDTEAPPNLDV